LKFSKNSQNHRIRISKFWSNIFCACVSCVLKKNLDSILTKLTEEIDLEVCPYGDSGNGTATAARRSTGYSDRIGGAAACSDRSSGAFGTGGVRNWGRNRDVKTNRLVCLFVCLCVSDQHFYPSTLTDFDETWSQGPYSDLVWPRP